ncbi:protein FAM207A isoform X2 [Scomber japonicus]|uniref:protein FAM207A isoform X2 n=1 Tax=Scomber japonicus TaxID=13676 RepID=UPI002305C5B6|nr:protein FAM207A isoform X2 [Scomber japonicus]
MVGKIKHVRQKLHQAAVKLDSPTGLTQTPGSGSESSRRLEEPPQKITPQLLDDKSDAPKHAAQAGTLSSFPTGIFAGTKISPEALVQTLKFEKPPEVPIPEKKGPEEKKIKSKKEKMKERRERWLNKISSIKQAKEQQAAEARRQATRRKSRKNKVPVKRPEPTDFSQMKQSQKRKLLETESGRFSDAVKTLSAKTNPLADIGEQLKKRMRQEEEQGPS